MTEEQSEKLTCPVCGEPIEHGASFCWNCENRQAHEDMVRRQSYEAENTRLLEASRRYDEAYERHIERGERHQEQAERHQEHYSRQLEEWDEIARVTKENLSRISKLLDTWELLSDRIQALLSRFDHKQGS
jgi:hypothetical protein